MSNTRGSKYITRCNEWPSSVHSKHIMSCWNPNALGGWGGYGTPWQWHTMGWSVGYRGSRIRVRVLPLASDKFATVFSHIWSGSVLDSRNDGKLARSRPCLNLAFLYNPHTISKEEVGRRRVWVARSLRNYYRPLAASEDLPGGHFAPCSLGARTHG